MNDTVRNTIEKRDDKSVIRDGGEWLALWSDPDSMKSEAELNRDAAEHSATLRMERRRVPCPPTRSCGLITWNSRRS